MELIDKTIYVLIFTDTKLERSFSKQQLIIPDFKQPYTLHNSSRSGGSWCRSVTIFPPRF